MQRIYKLIWLLGLISPAMTANADSTQITAINFSAESSTQISFDFSGPTHQRFFILPNPSRLVIDFLDMHSRPVISQPPADHPLFSSIRYAIHDNKYLRVVLELKADAEVQAIPGKQLNYNQLVLELRAKSAKPAVAQEKPATSPRLPVTKTEQPLSPPASAQPMAKHTVVKPAKIKGRDIIVAIDAGHGGKDVGAQGGNGTQEKDVVFAIAKRLENLISSHSGMRAVMIRNGDYFVPLKERVRIAQSHRADLFISIHADAFNDPSAHGASVYTLSNKGASSQGASWLADSENAADMLDSKNMIEKDDTLASVLLDLSQTAAKEASQNIGSKVLKSFKNVGHLHRTAVQKACFVVLKSPDIPSILVETAFISNPDEEQRLTNSAYQEKMASAVFAGIMAHFKQYAPANTLLAQQSKSIRSARLQGAEMPEPSAQNQIPAEAIPVSRHRLNS